MTLPEVILCRAFSPARRGLILFYILNIETGAPPAGWGVRRTISNKEFRTAEVFERNKKIFFTSIFCGSAVHILDVLIADNGIFDGSDSLL